MLFCSYVIGLLRDQWIPTEVASFPQVSWLWPAATATESGNALCLCSPIQQDRSAQAVQESCPKSLVVDFCPLNLRLPSGTALGEIARPAGAQTCTQTWTLPPDQRVVEILSPLKPQHKLCWGWILFKSVTDAKIEPHMVKFWMLMPQHKSVYYIEGYVILYLLFMQDKNIYAYSTLLVLCQLFFI